MRPRSQTIGTLGRTPARPIRLPPPKVLPPKPPSEPPPPERGAVARWFRGAFLTNIGLKFLSMVLAATVFLLVNTDRDRVITARVAVSYVLPDDKVLVSERLDEVRVTIKGRKLRGFDERELDPVTLDLRRVLGGELAITPDMVRVPAGMTVTTVSPSLVRVAFDRRVEKIVEVVPAFSGHPQHGYIVAEVKAVPQTVKVRGAEGLLRALSSVRTREISLDGHDNSFAAESELVPPDGVALDTSHQVNVQIRLDEELVTRKLVGIGVKVIAEGVDPTNAAQVNAAQAKWQITPMQIDVTLTGALLSVEKAKSAMVLAIKVTATETRAREAAVTIEGLPPGVGVKLSPERVRIVPTR